MRLATRQAETENLFETLANKAPVGLYVVQEGKFSYVNPAFESTVGYKEDELIGKDSLDLVIPEDREKVRQNAIKMLKGELKVPYEFRVADKQGSIRWVMESVVSIRYLGRRATLGYFVDLTEHKQLEEAAQAEKNKLQSLIDAMEDHLSIRDKDYNLIYMSERMNKTWGDRIGEKCYRVLEGQDKVCDGCPAEKAFKDGNSHTSVRRVVMPSGEVALWENRANPIRDAEGKIVACLEIARDITERRKMEDALRESREQLRNIFESVTDGVSVIGLDGVIKAVNQRMVEMHGFSSKDELIGKSALELVAARDRQRVAEHVRKAIKYGPMTGGEFAMLRADGSEYVGELSTSVLTDASGRHVGHVSISRDITERKKMQAALDIQRSYFQQLFDNSPDAIAMLDTDARVIRSNKGFESLFGYSPEEVKGRHIRELIIPEESMHEAGELTVAVLNSETFRRETVRRRKDGSLVDVSMLSYPIVSDGNVVGTYVIYTNITERKTMEQALADEATRRRILVEQSLDGIVVLDVDAKVVEANQRFADMLGYTLEEVHQLHTWDWDKQFSPEKLLEMGRSIDEKGLHLETKHTRKNGSVIDVDISISAATVCGQKLIFCICRDITERNRTAQALKLAAEQWTETFNAITDGISIHDRDYRIRLANRTFADLFHMEPGQIIGKHCYELHHRNGVISGCPHQQTLATRKPATAEFYESHLGKYLVESTSPIFDKQGEVIGTVHITRDITSQKQQRERLMMADRLAALGELLAGTAHELNNPLTSIMGLSHLLLESKVSDDIREDLRVINSEAQRAVRVTQNLLAFARKHTSVKQPSQINNIIEDVLKLRAYEQRANNIEVKMDLASDLPEIMVDYFQMQQVFLNIIINAEYFMTEAHRRGTLTITTRKQNSNVVISIADDGPGISEENLSRIFDPFFTTKPPGKGTGLGLSICHGIVAEHGGQIYARSQLGKGATIFVELPVQTGTRQEQTLEQANAHENGMSMGTEQKGVKQ